MTDLKVEQLLSRDSEYDSSTCHSSLSLSGSIVVIRSYLDAIDVVSLIITNAR